uniref:Uncharacterized protein n=1 Tax=Steinernema glaseri TaxID=37863 RepID=A0A1I7YRR2_9BILA
MSKKSVHDNIPHFRPSSGCVFAGHFLSGSSVLYECECPSSSMIRTGNAKELQPLASASSLPHAYRFLRSMSFFLIQ